MEDGYDLTLSGLLRKRAELARSVEAARKDWEAGSVALTAIDAAIRVFRPELTAADRPESRAAPMYADATVGLQRFLLDLLRRSGEPLTMQQVAVALVEERGIDPRDRMATTVIRKRCAKALGRLRMAGHVTGVRFGSGSELEWQLRRSDDQ